MPKISISQTEPRLKYPRIASTQTSKVYDVGSSFEIVECPQFKLCNYGSTIALEKVGEVDEKILYMLDVVKVYEDYQKLKKLNVDPKNIKNNLFWQSIYGAKIMSFEKLQNPANGANTTGQSELINSFPCHYCGIYLPEGSIDVDHFQPQANGVEGAAIIEILRALDVTYTSLPQSECFKPRFFGSRSSVDIHAEVRNRPGASYFPKGIIYPKGESYPSGRKESNNLRPENHALTEKGIIFLSYVFSQMPMNTKIFLNSILNLVPACGRCNRHKGDSIFSEF